MQRLYAIDGRARMLEEDDVEIAKLLLEDQPKDISASYKRLNVIKFFMTQGYSLFTAGEIIWAAQHGHTS